MANPTAKKTTRADAEVDEVLHHDVGDVLRPRETRLDEGEAGLHEDDEHGRQQDVDVVERPLECRRRRTLVLSERRHWAGHDADGGDQEPDTAVLERFVAHGTLLNGWMNGMVTRPH